MTENELDKQQTRPLFDSFHVKAKTTTTRTTAQARTTIGTKTVDTEVNLVNLSSVGGEQQSFITNKIGHLLIRVVSKKNG